MKPVEDYFKNPKRSIGGAVIPLIGPPGCGKTNSLIQLALMRRQDGHKVLWRGTEQGEWIKFLANGQKVTVWNHEYMDRVRVKASDSTTTTRYKLEELDNVNVREFSEASEVVEQSSKDRINVIQIPGLMGAGQEGRTFFTKTNLDILEAIIKRENTYNFVDYFTDEGGDIFPCQQQLSGEQYNQVVKRAPQMLSQLRKQNSFMYIAGHGTQDMHYFVWKIKSNTIGYMSNSTVKSFHSSIDQWAVNKLDRGELIVPPTDKERFPLAYEEDNLDWVGEKHVDLNWSYTLELEDEDKEETSENHLSNSQAAKKVYETIDDITMEEAGELFGVTSGAVANA